VRTVFQLEKAADHFGQGPAIVNITRILVDAAQPWNSANSSVLDVKD